MKSTEIPLTPRSIEPWRGLLSAERWAALEEAEREGHAIFVGGPVWCVNSTAEGGGVAEMLRTLLSYVRGAGFDARWAVIGGDPEFFAVTKRIHNFIHGSAGDGGSLGSSERLVYERVTMANYSSLVDLIDPGSIVILHDPQTAGLVRPLRKHGCTVLWRTHIGAEVPNEYVDAAWSFIEPYVAEADGLIFSRWIYIPHVLANGPTMIVPPSIDPFSPKNQDLDSATVRAIMVAAGLLGGDPNGVEPRFRRLDGSIDVVRRRAVLLDGGPPLDGDRPVVLQVSRWDRLKDHLGVMRGFAEHTFPQADADLLLVGPDASGVTDDPEGATVIEELCEAHRGLPERARRRVHIASLPMVDGRENAAIVNAVQRYATVVVQKSLAEGFGLTITEAMWKARPMIASEVGGIHEQVSYQTGVPLADPRDLKRFGEAVVELLDDPDRAGEIAAAGRQSVFDRFLHDRHFRQYFGLLKRITSPAAIEPL